MHKPQVAKLHVDERLEHRIRRQFPWVFDKDADFGASGPQLGDLVAIYGKRDQCIALGIYDPYSPIRVRILGKPCTFSEAYFARRLDEALARREASGIVSDQTNALRLVNGESEGLPGIVLDAYAGTWVMKIYSAAWLPYLKAMLSVIEEGYFGPHASASRPDAYGVLPHRLILRFGREALPVYEAAGYAEGALLLGEDDTPYADFVENGARFRAQVFRGQKTGFFLDQRDNRRFVRSLSEGRRVLDVCCYSGGFSIQAAMGGAREVWSLDGDRHALELVEQHYGLNAHDQGVAACTRVLQRGKMFAWLEQAKAKRMKFDLIIVDPPSFASSKAQTDQAVKSYQRLFSAAADCLAPKGQMLCCSCSSHVGSDMFGDIVSRTMRPRGAKIEDCSGLPADHVANFAEARYLKSWLVTLR